MEPVRSHGKGTVCTTAGTKVYDPSLSPKGKQNSTFSKRQAKREESSADVVATCVNRGIEAMADKGGRTREEKSIGYDLVAKALLDPRTCAGSSHTRHRSPKPLGSAGPLSNTIADGPSWLGGTPHSFALFAFAEGKLDYYKARGDGKSLGTLNLDEATGCVVDDK